MQKVAVLLGFFMAVLAVMSAVPAAAAEQHWALASTAYGGIKVPEWSVPAVVDIDADGDLDLFVGNGIGISFYRNDGTPQTAAWTFVTDRYAGLETMSNYPGAAFGDLDGDGDYDMIVGVIGDPVYFYRNDGTPQEPVWTLVTDRYIDVPVPGCSHIPSLIDLDSDGDLDFFLNSCDWISNYFENIGTRTTPALQLKNYDFVQEAVGLSGYGNFLAFEDINLDGKIDILASNTSGRLAYLRNTGTKSVPAWKLQTTEYADIYDTSSAYGYIFPIFADMDADGKREAIMGDLNGNLSFYENVKNVR